MDIKYVDQLDWQGLYINNKLVLGDKSQPLYESEILLKIREYAIEKAISNISCFNLTYEEDGMDTLLVFPENFDDIPKEFLEEIVR